jgi:hypothetical protein
MKLTVPTLRALTGGAVTALVVVTVTALAGASYSGQDGGGVIHACFKSDATLRIVDHFPCKAGETALSWNAVGRTGANGPVGDVGPRGPAGATAYDIAVANGYTGTAEQWLTELHGRDGASVRGATGAAGAPGAKGDPGSSGATGPSAYDVAVAHGYVGSVSAWLASLKGNTGAPGANAPGITALSQLDGISCDVAGQTGVVKTAVNGAGVVALTCTPCVLGNEGRSLSWDGATSAVDDAKLYTGAGCQGTYVTITMVTAPDVSLAGAACGALGLEFSGDTLTFEFSTTKVPAYPCANNL